MENSDFSKLFRAAANITDINTVLDLEGGCYSISQSTINKPTGMLDFGVMLLIARGSTVTGFTITWASAKIWRIHMFIGTTFNQIFNS